ncbi:MAG: Dabb family protein [Lachnospiraceae bacterium]|nr:Dabb family protein [Lachnospiraceae bacterium]MBP3737384.1 Dabb family protein [Lachnospiraceae bacterium]
MIKHIVMWNLKADIAESEKPAIKKNIKDSVEGLLGKIPGLQELHVHINGAETSTAEILLESVHDDASALALYQDHPEHVTVRDEIVAPFVTRRVAFDFEL